MQLSTSSFTLRPLAAASILLLGACSKKDDGATPTPATTYATTWMADGRSLTANVNSATVNGTTLSILVSQATSSTESSSLALNVPAAPGTYDLITGTSAASYSNTVAGITTSYGVANGYGGTGTVTVTTLSSREATGTFSFTAVSSAAPGSSTITVSNGKFAIKR